MRMHVYIMLYVFFSVFKQHGHQFGSDYFILACVFQVATVVEEVVMAMTSTMVSH